jgi:hypothetical protein
MAYIWLLWNAVCVCVCVCMRACMGWTQVASGQALAAGCEHADDLQ